MRQPWTITCLPTKSSSNELFGQIGKPRQVSLGRRVQVKLMNPQRRFKLLSKDSGRKTNQLGFHLRLWLNPLIILLQSHQTSPYPIARLCQSRITGSLCGHSAIRTALWWFHPHRLRHRLNRGLLTISIHVTNKAFLPPHEVSVETLHRHQERSDSRAATAWFEVDEHFQLWPYRPFVRDKFYRFNHSCFLLHSFFTLERDH